MQIYVVDFQLLSRQAVGDTYVCSRKCVAKLEIQIVTVVEDTSSLVYSLGNNCNDGTLSRTLASASRCSCATYGDPSMPATIRRTLVSLLIGTAFLASGAARAQAPATDQNLLLPCEATSLRPS